MNSLIVKIQKLFIKKYDFGIVIIIGIINAFVLMPSVTSSLAITSLEDGPVQPSVVYKNPEFYTYDFRASEFQRLMWTTSTKWLPALLYRYLNIDPKFAHILFTYLQTVLLLIGTFALAKALTKSRKTAYISVAFVIILAPYFNNFGSYGDQFFMPYGTWISIGPLLLAWANSIVGKQRKSFLWLAIGASIHPSMALTASIAIVAFEYFPKQKLKQNIKKSLRIFFPAIFFSAIAGLVRYMAQADKIPAPWFSALKEVLHWYAWKLNPANTGNAGATNGIDYFQTTTYSILLIFCCFIATQSSVFKFPERLQMNVKKLIIFFIALYFLQAVSFELNISQLFSISFGRFSIFTSIFSVIIFSSCISFLTQNNSQKIIFSSLLIFCLIIPSNLNLALFAFILLINELRQTNHKNTFKFAVTFFIILTIIFSRADYNDDWWIGSIYKFIPFSFHTVPNYLALKMIEYLSMYSWLLILAILIVHSIYKNNSHKNYFIVGVIIFLTILTLGGRYVLSDRRSETHNDWLETQLWALNHSKVNSKFIINSGFDLYESWTTLTRRPRLIADLSAGFLYFYTKEDQEYDVSRSQLPDAPSPTSEASKIENFYLLFGHKYGADYLVWKNKYTPLTFKKVYMNSQYVVYQLPDN